MKKLIPTLIVVLFTITFNSYAQTDSVLLRPQQQQLRRILNAQTQEQTQIQLNFEEAREKIFGAINDMVKTRREAKSKLRNWRLSTLDSVQRGLLTNITIDDVDRLYEEKQKDIDSAYYRSVEFLYARNKYKKVRVFPAFNGYMSMLYYNSEKKFDFFQSTSLSSATDNDNGSFESEIVSAYFLMFRTSLSTVLAKEEVTKIKPEDLQGKTDDQIDSLIIVNDSINTSKNTLVKVISGGGEANLTFKAPLLNILGNHKKSIKIKSDVALRLSANLPVAGNSISSSNINTFNMVGIENRLIIPFINFNTQKKEGYEAFSIFGRYDIKNVGGSDKFYESLGVAQERFWYSEYSVGLSYKNYLIYYTDQTFYHDELKGSNNARISVALIKEF